MVEGETCSMEPSSSQIVYECCVVEVGFWEDWSMGTLVTEPQIWTPSGQSKRNLGKQPASTLNLWKAA
eukprot:12415468-Ditylum_brightwellii.AAC.1